MKSRKTAATEINTNPSQNAGVPKDGLRTLNNSGEIRKFAPTIVYYKIQLITF